MFGSLDILALWLEKWLNHVESLFVLNPVISCITSICFNGKYNCSWFLEYKLVGGCIRLLDKLEWGDGSVYSWRVTDLFASYVYI